MNNGKYWDKAWSLVEGCTPVSEACDNCWLAAMAFRFPQQGQSHFAIACKVTGQSPRFIGNVTTRPDRLEIPLKVKKPTVWAIWSDLFHEKVPNEFINKTFMVMDACRQHTFLILTKRPKGIPIWLKNFYGDNTVQISKHIWLGVTVEKQQRADERISELLKVGGKKFLSLEPLLGPINLISDINWVVVGAESGPHRRECKIEWIESIVEQCKSCGLPVFVKQIHLNGKLVKDINQFPEHLRIRERPF